MPKTSSDYYIHKSDFRNEKIETEQYYEHTFWEQKDNKLNGKFLASVTPTKQVAKAVICV